MKKWFIALLTLVATQIAMAAADPLPSLLEKAPSNGQKVDDANEKSFLEKYPNLKPNVYTEPNSNLYLGFSVGVLGVLKSRMFFSANFFQVHYLTSFWDAEVLSVSYGTTTANPSYVQSNHFVFRTVPKYRINNMLSIGPLLGWEYVSFPLITATINNGVYTTKPEPFSSSGMIYGVGASENITTEKFSKLKISQLLYKQTYSTKDAGHGWDYHYNSRDLNTDTTPIEAGVMFLVEVGFLF